LLGAVRRGGKIASLGAVPDEETQQVNDVTASAVMAQATGDVIGPLAEQAASGKLKVVVDSVVPLDKAMEALGAIAAGKANGKIVVDLER
jgi:NADPH:quinone reductase-like Zn-dependent oxidoreductase